VHELIAGFDPDFRAVWDDADEALRTRMVAGIVPFEMDVTRLEGNFKLGQNRSSEGRAGIVAHLTASTDTNTAALGQAMVDRAMQPARPPSHLLGASCPGQ